METVRRLEQPPPAMQIRRAAGMTLFLAIAGSLMYVLASMRQLYVHLLEAEQGSLQQQVEQLTQGGAASTIARAASTDLGTAGVTLLVVNVALFAFGAAASFLRHDPHPDYEGVWRVHQRSRRRLSRLTTRYEKAAAARQREFDQRLSALDAMMRETQTKHEELAASEAALGPFFADTVARVANTVRNRSLAFLEGALGALAGAPSDGSVAELQALSEREILHRIAPDASAPP